MKHSYVGTSLACVLALQTGITHATTYTLNADFDQGIMDGVDYRVTDQLQLSEKTSVLPFIWVANSSENTVSKINTETGCELGRYRTGPGGENPSRTTVDSSGDLWVGNRDSNTATKIALEPSDLNGDGIIKTSKDLNGNCLIEPSEVLPWGQDEAILLRINVDFGPRAVAVDAKNNVWIGGYGLNMGYYDGITGQKLKNIYIGRYCYGALVDRNGALWISNQAYNSLTRIDNPSEQHTMQFIPADGFVYGISIDSKGYIYTAGWDSNKLRKYDPANSRWLYSTNAGGWNGRGVAVGLDGDVWVAHSVSNFVTRHDASTGAVKATIPVGNHPTGVATAADGKIWVTNYYSSDIMRVDPVTNKVDFSTPQGSNPGPYNYSDMTGLISRNITTKRGTWLATYDEGSPSLCKATLTWNSETPADSTFAVTVQSSADGQSWSPEQQVLSGIEFPTVEDSAFIKIKAEFAASTKEQLSPILQDLTVSTVPCNRPPVAVCKDVVVAANNQCTATSASIDDGSYDPDDDPIVLRQEPTGPFLLGVTTTSLNVADPLGATSTCSAKVTVKDSISPVIAEASKMLVIKPNNHKYQNFTLANCIARVTDNCDQSLDPNLSGSIVSISSDEPEDVKGEGDGNTVNDMVIISDHEFQVRSERQGKGNGRVYEVKYVIVDDSGNTTNATCLIGVAHDQSSKPIINDGPTMGYTVFATN